MRHYIYIIILILMCGANTTPLYSQRSLTLEQYRKQVLDYSYQIKISAESSNAAAEKFKMVRTGFFPSVGAVVNGSYQQGNEISFGSTKMKNYNYASTLTLQQAIYAGGSVRAGSKAASIEYDISQSGEDLTVINVAYTADMTYWAFAASKEQRAIARTYVDIVRSLYEIVNVRFKDGYISRTDLLMVETRLNEAELNLISAHQLYLNSLVQLCTLMGKDLVEGYETTDSIANIRPIQSIISNSTNIENHPEYRVAELKVNLQNQNIKITRSKYNPQFNVGVQGVYGTPSLNFMGNAKLYGVAFASLNIPIFMWGERRHNVSMVRSSVRSSEYTLNDTEDRIRAALSEAIISLEQTLKQTQIAERNLSVAKENLDLNTFSYREGRLPILDVLQSQLAWIQAYTAFVNTNYSYQTAVASYYKSAGTGIN